MKTIGRILAQIWFIGLACTEGYSYVNGGRWWTYISILFVVLNDAAAYFIGKAFGKHHLLRISPNKTIEGFMGAFLSNVIVTYIMASYFLKDHFWICPPKRFNTGFYEVVECENPPQIYVIQQF